MMFEFADDVRRLTDIRVAGVGGAGGNAVDRMVKAGLSGVEFLALNTDLQALSDSRAHQTMQIGAQLTQGLGSGGKPSVGEGAAEEDRDSIRQALDGANMVFVTAGMGGGTGTGAAPVVAEIARKQGALTVGIVTKPFVFEGRVRMAQAEDGIARLREVVDTLIVVPNQRLLEIVPPNTSMDEAFLIADQVLYEATRGIYEIISRHDTLNLDFADVCSVMRGMGVALMGTGRASGENRALEAAKAAIKSPLLENLDIYGSQAVLVNVLGGQVGLHDTAEAMQFIQEAAGPEAHVIFGYGVDESLGENLQVTVIATGFQADQVVSGTVSMAAVPVVNEEPVTEEETPEYLEPQDETDSEPVGLNDDALYAGEEDVVPEMVSVLDEDDPGIGADSTPEEFVGDSNPPLFDDPRHQGLDQSATPDTDTDTDTEAEVEQMVKPSSVLEPLQEQLQEPLPEQLPEPETVAEEPQPTFLKRAASAGGPAVDVPRSEANSRFLRPVGRRNIGEVEVPETEKGPVPISRSTASGLGPEKPGEDRSTPAYIRKYMD